MIRRLMHIVEVLAMMIFGILFVVAYATFPIWLIVWVIWGWWIYPWGKTLHINLEYWFETQTTDTNILGEYYTMEDYHERKRDWKRQDWDDD